jgi:phosphocarrier protein HPr
MPRRHIETRNIVFHKAWAQTDRVSMELTYGGQNSMSRTIEAIMRHTTLPSSPATHQRNSGEKLEREITVKKQHYIWSEARFVRTMRPFDSNVRVSYNGTEVDGKSVLDLMTLTPPDGTKVRIRIEGPDAAEAMHAVDQFIEARSDDD